MYSQAKEYYPILAVEGNVLIFKTKAPRIHGVKALKSFDEGVGWVPSGPHTHVHESRGEEVGCRPSGPHVCMLPKANFVEKW